MAYIKETISTYGDKIDFANALKNFLVNNEIAPFELISEDLTTASPSFTFERNNLNLQVIVSASNSINSTRVIVSSKVSEDEYSVNIDTVIRHTEAEMVTSTNRALKFLLIKNDETVILQIAAWNAASFSNDITIIDATLANGINLIGTGKYNSSATTIPLKETTTQLTYIARPFHTGSNDETTLILSNTLAVNNSSGVYVSDMLGAISAGGAKQFGYYITDLNTYYGLFTDVCIPMGDRVEYTVSDTIAKITNDTTE